MAKMHKLKVLIDFTQIPIQKLGVGVYGLNLVSNLNQDDNIHYYVIAQDDENGLDEYESDNFTLIKIKSKICRKFFARSFLEQLYLPFLAYKYDIDVIHSLHYSFPIVSTAYKVVTVHDMTFFMFPKLHLPIKTYYFRFFIGLTARMASKVICVSEATSRDYLARYPAAFDKVHIIQHGKGKEYVPSIDAGAVSAVKEKYDIRGRYILFIGTIEPRKNIVALVDAYRRLVEEGTTLQLVISGKKGWHYDEVFRHVTNLGLSGKVLFTGFIEEQEKPALLAGAHVFVYPSIYEGFGLPVLEALACGVPTVTSNVSSMPEVAGDAALLVDPTDVDELTAAIRKLIDDGDLRDEMRKKAIRRSDHFTWQGAARKTISVYKSFNTDGND